MCLPANNASASSAVQLSNDFASIRITMNPAVRLPDEVLLIVFELLLPQPGSVRSSYLPGPNQPWSIAHRTMTSLPLVCRGWYPMTVPYLYVHATIRHFPQIALLARTLRNDPDKFGPLIRRLTFAGAMCDVLVPMGDVRDILAHCPSLHALSLEGLTDMTYCQGQLTLRTYQGHPSLEEELIDLDEQLETQPQYRVGTILLPPSTLNNLQSLSIQSLSISVHDTRNHDWQPALVFPRLTTLTLWINHDLGVPCFPNLWDTPSLKDLRLRPMLSGIRESSLLDFLGSRAARLESLDFGRNCGDLRPAYMMPYSMRWVAHVVQQCDALKHLVFEPAEDDAVESSVLFTRPLQFVDIIVPSSRICAHQPFTIPEGSAWAHVRYFDRPLLDLIPDIAHVIPPTETPPAGDTTTDFFGVTVRQRGSWIYHDNWCGLLSRDHARSRAVCCFPDINSEGSSFSDVEADDESETSSLYEYESSDQSGTSLEETDMVDSSEEEISIMFHHRSSSLPPSFSPA